MSGIASFFIEGGIWMIPIGIASAFALAIAIERFYALYILFPVDGRALTTRIFKSIRDNQITDGIKACDVKPDAALSRVLKAGLMRTDEGISSVQNAMEEATMEVIPSIQKRGGSLASIASLATLLGLLGTVMGLIEAFRVVAEAPMDQKSILLTKSISVAMNTTAFGLLVAIPVMVAHLAVSGRIKKLVEDIDQYSLKMENVLASRRSAK